MLVSVLMSVYNSEEYLENAIASVLTQTFHDFEFIIIDDGSTDRSKDIVKTYSESDSRIVLIENEKNLGLPASLNKAIRLCKGMYIARQDADDFSSPNRLQLQLEYALSNPHIDVVGSDCFNMDIEGNIVFLDSSFSKITDLRKTLLNQQAIFPHGSALVKKDRLISCGLYDTRFYYVQDGELWLRLITDGASIHVMDKPLYYYRVTPVENAKKIHAKLLFNRVLNFMYEEKMNATFVDQKLCEIRQYLNNNESIARAYYMADYWKGLGNTAYVNDRGVKVCANYIKRAVQEQNPVINYAKYIILILVYLVPPFIARFFLRSLNPS